MALLYDSFGIRDVQVLVNVWPEFGGFAPGQLSKLYGHLNDDDSFPTCDLRTNLGARFEGEQWTYDIDSDSITLICSSFATTNELRTRVRELLGNTRKFFQDDRPRVRRAFFVDEIRMMGHVPEDRGRNVGEVMRSRLMRGVKAADLGGLPGLYGAGLRLIGDTDEFHWHAALEPPHGSYGLLALVMQLMYPPPSDPPNPNTDLDIIDKAVETGYEFLTENLKTFANTLVK